MKQEELKTLQKQEAIKTMKILQLHSNVINDCLLEDKLNKSESLGTLFWLNDEEKEIVKRFNEEHPEKLVYHILKTETQDLGTVFDLLFINDFVEDWEADKEFAKQDYVLSYTISSFPEFGFIKVKRVNGGLVREY